MLSQAYQAHLRWMRTRGLADSTITHRQQALARLAEWAEGQPLADITAADLAQWADSLTRHARATRAVYISHIRSYYKWAYDEEQYPANPAARLPVPRLPRRIPRPIAEDKLAAALDNTSHRVRTWLVLAAAAGLRAKEIALLRGENVRLDGDQPYIHVVTDATKGITERVIPLSPSAAAELRAAGLPPRGPCWRKADGSPVSPNLVSKTCNRHLHDFGITDTLHSLRHRFLTEVQRAGRDLRVTQEIAGHATPMSTAGYSKVAAEDARAAVAAVPPLPLRYGGAA